MMIDPLPRLITIAGSVAESGLGKPLYCETFAPETIHRPNGLILISNHTP